MYTFGGEKLGKGSSGGRERYVAAVGAMEKVYDVVVVVTIIKSFVTNACSYLSQDQYAVRLRTYRLAL